MRVRFLAAVITGAAAVTLLLSGCSSVKVSKDDVAEQIKTQLTAQVGQEPDSVECPDDLEGKVGATQRCTLTAGKTKYGVLATVTKVDGSKVSFDIKVDDKPME